MNRREAIRHSATWAGVAALWASLPARTWAALALPAGWSEDDEQLLTLIGDTIIPATAESPGAGAVGIGRFMIVQATAKRALLRVDGRPGPGNSLWSQISALPCWLEDCESVACWAECVGFMGSPWHPSR